jgi:DNA-binding LytR/AlgR family response regulator
MTDAPSPTAAPAAPSAHTARALIAEDEPLLAAALERELLAAWPGLQIVARATDGPTAAVAALAERPDVLFLDIQLPGASGLEVAAEVADEWPAPPAPLVVFVTAFEQHALAAFERAAVDYLLKPVLPERLALTVKRVQERLAHRLAGEPAPARDAGAAFVQQMQGMQQALAAPAGGAADPGGPEDAGPATERIRVIRAGQGTRVRMIPLAEVVYFEAADKYVNVVTEGGAALVRLSLRELAARVEGVEFLQVHRSVLVNHERILGAERDEAGHYWLTLRGWPRPLKVSRAFSHLFRPM